MVSSCHKILSTTSLSHKPNKEAGWDHVPKRWNRKSSNFIISEEKHIHIHQPNASAWTRKKRIHVTSWRLKLLRNQYQNKFIYKHEIDKLEMWMTMHRHHIKHDCKHQGSKMAKQEKTLLWHVLQKNWLVQWLQKRQVCLSVSYTSKWVKPLFVSKLSVRWSMLWRLWTKA